MPDSDPLAWLNTLEGVPSAFVAARDGIDALLRDRGLRRTSKDQTTESLLRGAHASAVLEGSDRDLDQMRAGNLDAPAAAALRVSTELLGLAPILESAPAQAFARLHALADPGLGTGAQGPGQPVSAEAAQRLQTLGRTLQQTTAPALMVAAVVHAELHTVAPFASFNGIVARAAERLVLLIRGVDPTSVVVPEAGHLAWAEEYRSNLRGYRDGGRAGLQSWLRYAAEAYPAAVEASPLRDH